MAKIFNNTNVAQETGCLNGNFEDCLKYLAWTINVKADKNFTAKDKGEAFFNAVKTLKERFGVGVSTHYLKHLCDSEMRGKMLHILYMLRIGGFMDITENPNRYMVNPSKVAFKGFVNQLDGRRSISPKVFDFLVFPNEWEEQKAREQAFKQKCIKEFEDYEKMIEKEKLELAKLQMVANLEEKPISYEEQDSVCPHLIKRDFRLQGRRVVRQGYH